MKRREFIALLGGAVVTWPLVAGAQQPLPVIGFLCVASPEAWTQYVAAFKNGLGQTGFVEGQNVTIEYRWAYGDFDAGEIEHAIAVFARGANGGLILVGPTSSVQRHRDLIVALAARHRLPAVYANRLFVTGGGLISYAPDSFEQYRRAAGYVDRILKGEKPADLPVQAPTKFELVVNLKTAKALGLELPASVLARADEVID
jgi:putative ABC transport system substrate-binding protein